MAFLGREKVKLSARSVTDSFVVPRWRESERLFWKIDLLRLEIKRRAFEHWQAERRPERNALRGSPF